MEFIVVALVVAAIWFVVSGNYKIKIQDPQTLRPDEIEDSIVELKKKILVMMKLCIMMQTSLKH